MGIPLFAQNFRDARIFVPPVNGVGAEGDNAFFYRQLTYEVVLQYHSLVRTRGSSDFILRGTIMRYAGEEQFLKDHPQEEPEDIPEEIIESADTGPVPPRPIPRIRNTSGRREFFSWENDGEISFFDTTGEGNYNPPEIENETVFFLEPDEEGEVDDFFPESQEFIFTLELISSLTGATVAKQYLIYRNVDAAAADLVSVIVYNMLSNIPDIEADIDWRENWLFAGVNAMWAPRIYTGQEQSVSWVNFGIGASLEYHFLDYLSVGLGLQFVQDWVVVTKSPLVERRDLLLELPLSVSYVIKPLQYIMQPYAGVSLNFSLFGTTTPSILSWFAGFQFGMKAGPGMIVFDPRFSMDFFKSTIPQNPAEYRRYLIQISVGYKFGFLPKQIRPRDY